MGSVDQCNAPRSVPYTIWLRLVPLCRLNVEFAGRGSRVRVPVAPPTLECAVSASRCGAFSLESVGGTSRNFSATLSFIFGDGLEHVLAPDRSCAIIRRAIVTHKN
jgi:hypothetical protein